MIIDGKKLAEKRREELRREREKLGALSLGVVIAVSDTVTQSYIGIKKKAAEALGIDVVEYRLSGGTTADAIVAVEKASVHDGIITQLPMPGIDIDAVRNAIPLERDVDVLGDAALKRFAEGRFPPTPPVPAAMQYVLSRNAVSLKGKKVAIVGYGRLVGRPAATLFKHLGASVSISDKGDDIAGATKVADIIALGTGVAGILTPDMIKEGAIILDAGASEANGKVVGDADPKCAEKASLFTPVPGGLGPVAVVEIFANLIALKAGTA
jgi:methylenetetrahydrofolate dehydrogenase (NADP+)/methenyltetrahydrofolate cyclohydrolase